MNKIDLVIKAQKEISSILQKLEQDTGFVVNQISINDVNITTVYSDNASYIRTVSIDFEHPRTRTWS